MNDSSALEILKEKAKKLISLLDDPQSEMFTWRLAVARTLDEIAHHAPNIINHKAEK